MGGESIPHGGQCEFLCPDTGEPLPVFGDPCPDGSAMQSIQLTASYQPAHIGAIGNRWGSTACRVFDSSELLELLVLQEAP